MGYGLLAIGYWVCIKVMALTGMTTNEESLELEEQPIAHSP